MIENKEEIVEDFLEVEELNEELEENLNEDKLKKKEIEKEIEIEHKLYNAYSDSLKEEYGEKVYKIPINLPVSCPNRDGNVGCGGCTYCGEKGTGFESQDNMMSVENQIEENIKHIAKKYSANKYIAYFQNFSNTYMPLDNFKNYVEKSIREDIVEIDISTRPDCIAKPYLDVLKDIKEKHNINITIELGLQTTNVHTLNKINRGHTLAEYIEAVLMIKEYNFKICTHVILNLPWDNDDDVIEMAKILSSLKVDYAKAHSLYMVRDTIMAKMYENKEFEICKLEDYKRKVKLFLSYLDPNIVIERLIARAPKEDTLFVNWYTSWWKIRDELLEEMKNENIYQGKYFNYLGGKALKNKNYI